MLDLVRGKDVQRAAEILDGTEREAAEVIGKVLSSAVANAAHNDQQDPDELYVSACFADEGATHEALAPPGARPRHADPQAHVPHHDRREPAAGRPAGAAPHAQEAVERQPVPPGRRLAPARRPVGPPVATSCRPGRRPASRRPPPTAEADEAGGRATRPSTDRATRPTTDEAGDEADADDGRRSRRTPDGRRRDGCRRQRRGRPTPTRPTRPRRRASDGPEGQPLRVPPRDHHRLEVALVRRAATTRTSSSRTGRSATT